MADDGLQRKLRAILSADVKGYSLLMADDEAYTVDKLKEYRSIMSDIIQSHSGRVVDAVGDNLLAEFSSAVDAVQCSVEIQKALKERNDPLTKNKRLEFRIGINIGDVIQDKDRIYGSGVNVAARIEGLAEPGGICISRNAYDHIKEKLGFGYEYLGDHKVKNINDPVRVYKVLTDPEDAGKIIDEKTPKNWRLAVASVAAVLILFLGGLAIWNHILKPSPSSRDTTSDDLSIAVLPFKNMSGDPEQQYFSDGITEQIITSISKVPYLFVIARQSSFALRDKQMTVQQIAKELGVRYILEGSLQRSGERLRINAQLIDATSGHHLWAENYDHKLDDIFSVQDDICKNIMVALQVKLTTGEMARIYADTVNDIRAYEKYLKGLERYCRRNKEDSLIAQQLFQEAITLDPEYVAPYIFLGYAYLDEVWFGMTKKPSESIAKAEEMVQKAIAIKGDTAIANSLLSSIYLLKKDLDKAIAYAEKAVEQTPSDATSYFMLGMALRYNGQYEAAISSLKKALKLNPVRPLHYLNNLAWAYTFSKQYGEAISTWNETIERNPDYLFAHMGLTAAHWFNNSQDQARTSCQARSQD